MSILRTGLMLASLLLISNQVFAQAISKDYQKIVLVRKLWRTRALKAKL